jgi:hypothetical protein
VILAALASLLIVIFDADLNKLIQLYLVGVFISFTLSQAGMVVHWRKERQPGWRQKAFINGFGSIVTGVVFCVVVTTKFLGGAWIVVSAIPLLILLMRGIHNHYGSVARQLAHPDRRPLDRRVGDQSIVIVVDKVDAAAARAVGYVRHIRPRSATAVTFDKSVAAPWKRLAPEMPITVCEMNGSLPDSLRPRLNELKAQLEPEEFLTVVVPEMLQRTGFLEILRRPRLHRLKAALLRESEVNVLDIPVLSQHLDVNRDEASEPARNHVIALVSGVHNAALQAIEYAETLGATDLRALSFALDPADSERIGERWLRNEIPVPLEIHDSPFRDIGRSLAEYVRQFDADGVHRVVTVVLPEFVVTKMRHQFLHGQTALIVKRRLLFERGVVLASVPYHLAETTSPAKTRETASSISSS